MPDTAPLTIQPLPLPEHEFRTLPGRMRRHAAERPDHPALREGERMLTWAQTCALAERAAALMIRKGLTRRAVVSIVADTPLDYCVAYLAGLAAGGCVAPMPVTAADATLATMIADAGAPCVVASASQKDRVEAILASKPGLANVAKLALDFEAEGWTKLLDMDLPAPGEDGSGGELPEIEPEDLFNIIYSSGTTGIPKGIVHTHLFRSRQMPRFTANGVSPDSRTLLTTPLYSNTTLVAMIATLAEGGTVTFLPKWDTPTWLGLVESQKITCCMLVPVLIQRLFKAEELAKTDISSLELTICTSSPLAAATKNEIIARWPGRFIELYGLTEGGVSAMLDLKAFPDKSGSVGQPALGSDLVLLDDDDRPVPQGEVGEVVGRSPAMMAGYHGRDDLTEKALLRLEDGRVVFRSGDLGRIDEDGFLYIVGRKKDMIISGGFNIYATDLEEALHAHPDVQEVGVVGAPSEAWGETPVAGVVLRPGASADAQAILDGANANLGKTQRVSALHVLDALPRNAVGKVLKPDLLAAVKDRAPDAVMSR
ncbi:AMP-binding protein [Albimonas sp. CAU 1670]|uniref:class I adenylate-forming enzyme family protein n=1 Tax=Albimonas sp. CAU 1670 TaxID=3032599 RepID=UPI0023DA0AC5|nr:AMP-binding protein [Albimonas sp. CAU 1670]MDF2234904.1 AMP-binding protein [Albimonas sp. CAU 1670]